MSLALTRRLQGVAGLRQLMPATSGLHQAAADLQQQRFAGEGQLAGVGGRSVHCGAAAAGRGGGGGVPPAPSGGRRALMSQRAQAGVSSWLNGYLHC
jgi:hypothetical protein